MTEKTHHVAEKKKEIAKNIEKLILDYPIIAAVNMENLPTPQLQQMRSQLRDKIVITMTKRRIMKHAIEGVKDKKKNIEKLEEHLKGMPALIFTKENPFSLFKTLKKSKTSAPAKAGQTAPFDLKILQGPTGFAPGPVIGELAQLGIKSGVESGKVVIKEDSIVVKEGEKISAKAAEILTRLGVEPMEVGLNVTAVYENGEIFTANILDIDEEKFMKDLQNAVLGSFNLAINSAYITKDTINLLIGKAFNDAKALGLGQNIIDEGIIDDLLGKAEGSALSLKSTAKIETVEKPKEAPKEEAPKVEEKPKEEKKPEVKAEVNRIKDSKYPSGVKGEPTPTEKKEEKVLEEEKKIIEEEKKLEKPEKPKIEAPVEKEVRGEVKEEEEKQLEKERIEKEKELEKIQEQRKIEEVKREEEKRKAEEERKKQEEARKKEEEQKKKEEEAKRKKAEEDKRKEEEEARRKKEEEAKRREEEIKKKLEEEKKILEEEKRLEEEAKKPKIEAPVEKEVREEVKEEEEKQLEKERIEKEKEIEKIEKEEPKDDTDKKIAEMVAKTKEFIRGDIPDAEKLVEEAGKLAAKEVEKEVKVEEKPKEEIKIEKKIPEEKKEEVKKPRIEGEPIAPNNLSKAQTKVEEKPREEPKGVEVKEAPKVQEKVSIVEKKKEEDSEKKKKEQKEIEDLAQELIRKGTLRKS